MEASAAWLSVASNAYGLTMGWGVTPACPEHPMWWGGQDLREDPAFGRYGKDAAAVDGLSARTDLLMVWPAGNERLDTGVAAGQPHFHAGSCATLFDDFHVQELTLQYGTLGGAAVAKNSLTVGAVRNVARAALTSARIGPLDMSSFGPTDDGRIKPDLVAGGEAVRSASARGDDQYSTLSGTSSATAATAGVVALLTELYRTTHAGADPRAAELKALLVQTARESGAPGPDYGTGYGLLDAQAAAELVAADGAGPGSRRLQVAALEGEAPLTLMTGEPVAAGVALRVTLAWSDPPAPVSTNAQDDATPALVNDLDLVLLAPDGTTSFHPWALDPARPEASATRNAPNRRDNVEVVDVDAADNLVAGRWSVRVEAHSSLWRGRPQPFALVASVPLATPEQAAIALPRYASVELAAGQAPPALQIPIANRGGGALHFQARALTPWLAVTSANGTAPSSLTLELDAAALTSPGEYLGRVVIDSDDPAGPRTLGVIARVTCVPDCTGRSCGPDPRCGELCGDCSAGDHCDDGECTAFAQRCPQAQLGSQLGLALLSGTGSLATGLEGGSCGGDAAHDLGVSWTAPEAGRYAFSTRGSDLDTVLYLRDGACTASELGCNDDSGGTTSALALELAAGQRVTAFIDGLSAQSSARFELNVERATCPSVELGSRLGQGLVRGSSFGGIDMLAGSCGGKGAEDVSLRWVAPARGRYRFSLFEPRFQAVLYLRDGDCEGNELGCTAAADIGPLEPMLEAGQAVVVVVDGREGKSGDFALDIIEAQASCAGACGGAVTGASCFCDASCVAAGDCCADACQLCGACRCQRSCLGHDCGADGCGGSCGDCGSGQSCDAAGKCVADLCAGVTCDACAQCMQGRCAPLADGAACEDGDLCTVLDTCQGGTCRGAERACDDGFACTRDRCDARTGECQHLASPGCCEPGEACADSGACDKSASECVATLGDAGLRGDGGSSRDGGGGATTPARIVRPSGGGCACRIVGQGRRPQPANAFAQLALVLAGLWRHRRKR
jgi:hypothetical protein